MARRKRSPYRLPIIVVLLSLALYALVLGVQWLADHPAIFWGIVGLVITSVILAVYVRRRRRAFGHLRVRALGKLLTLTPAQFEVSVGSFLHDLGYRNLKRVGRPGDLGADLMGRDTQGRSVVVQCKRYGLGYKVGATDIQTFIGMQHVHHHAERGVIVTTSEFTQPARLLAQRHGIFLVDGYELSDFIRRDNVGQRRRVRAGRLATGARVVALHVGGFLRRLIVPKVVVVSPESLSRTDASQIREIPPAHPQPPPG